MAALKGKKNVIILERTDEALSGDNPLGRDIRTALSKAIQTEGRPAVVRLKVPAEGETSFRDELRGAVTFSHNNVDDAILVFRSEAAGTREADAAAEKIDADFAAVTPGGIIQALEVHRLPERARFNARGVQFSDQAVARTAESLFVDQEAA